jgi:Leucine Rich repeat
MLLVKEMLKKNRTLESINLAFNDLGDQGALYLAEGLKSNTTLTQLSFSMAGGRTIMEALYTNTKPEAIELRIYTPKKTDQMRGVIWQELIGDKPVNLKLKAFKKHDEQDGMATQTPPLTPARKALQFSPPRHPQPYARSEYKGIMPQALLPSPPVGIRKHSGVHR